MSDDTSLDSIIEWTNVTSSDRFLLENIKTLLQYHPKLLALVFDQYQPQLRAKPTVILSEIGDLSSGEKLMVRLALDIWNSLGEVKIMEPVERLDDRNFQSFINCLHQMRSR